MFRHFSVAVNYTQTTKQGFEMACCQNFEGLIQRTVAMYKRYFIEDHGSATAFCSSLSEPYFAGEPMQRLHGCCFHTPRLRSSTKITPECKKNPHIQCAAGPVKHVFCLGVVVSTLSLFCALLLILCVH